MVCPRSACPRLKLRGQQLKKKGRKKIHFSLFIYVLGVFPTVRKSVVLFFIRALHRLPVHGILYFVALESVARSS